MTDQPHCAVACNLDANLLQASLPLFASEKVAAIEWSFDALFRLPDWPGWFVELLRAYALEGRLIGHGIYFSLLSGRWSAGQEQWLTHLAEMARTFRFDHVSEHFGFMTGENFHAGAPIGVPFTAATLAIGRDRLARLQQAAQCPVGLENLALAYSLDEVRRHGAFLAELVEPVNGFIILDLHNLYCQLHNFDVEFDELIALYPLDRVREIHISGGSWEDSPLRPGRPVRRDTHDDAVPPAVFQLLEAAAGRCPNLKFVVLEQLGTALDTEPRRRQFRQDFFTMEKIVVSAGHRPAATHDFRPSAPHEVPARPLEDPLLYAQQCELSAILETAAGYDDARRRLFASGLVNTAWAVEQWAPEMLETVVRLAQKWKNGFVQAKPR